MQTAGAAGLGDGLWAVGLDVGGTKIAGGLVEGATGRLRGRRTLPTGALRGGEAVLADVLAVARDLLAEARAAGLDVAGIGLGVAELVDARGRITSEQTIGWRGLPVQERLCQLAPAVVESDVRAAALAEAAFGAGRSYSTFAYVTVGTGISSCLVQDGRPYGGARGNALVLATAPLTATCPHCGAEVHTVVEEIASGPALVTRYNAIRGAQAEVTGGHEVLAAAGRGDAAAQGVVRSAGAALGMAVGFLANVLDPMAIVVGGGLGLAGGLYWDSFVSAVREHIWSEETRGLAILTAALGIDAGTVGAATALLRRPT